MDGYLAFLLTSNMTLLYLGVLLIHVGNFSCAALREKNLNNLKHIK